MWQLKKVIWRPLVVLMLLSEMNYYIMGVCDGTVIVGGEVSA